MIEGIYIHIPFCSIKCPYCDFLSITINDREIYKRYINTLLEELDLYSKENFNIKTIYFGGGTPSALEPKELGRIINYIKDNFKTAENLEIPIEANPKDYSVENFLELKSYGVNRVSIGNQSFLEKNLISLGRTHKPEDSYKTIEDCLKAGIKNINLDLIFGIEGQTLKDLEEDLKIYTSLDIKHISAYMLTPYEDTPLGQLVKQGKYKMPEEELLAEMYTLITEYLKNKNFKKYELSNWAKEGYECKHNLIYWQMKEFLGVGVSSWSFVNKTRFGNIKNIYEYMKKVSEGIKPILFKDKLDEKELLKEKIMLSLRLTEGVDITLINIEKAKPFIQEGFCKIENNKLKLTTKGFLVSNYIIGELME
jgi:oxygen-independent coproporphyrinogen-3 oxidase